MDHAVLHFIETAAAARDVAHLNEAFLGAMRGYGIDLFAAALLDPVSMMPEHFLASNYPSHWIEHYTGRGYDSIDPVVLQSRNADQAFLWAKTNAGRPARQLFDEASEVGIVSGFAVPVVMRNGRRSVVSVTSGMSGREFARLLLSRGNAVQTIIYCYHDTLCDLAGLGGHRPGPLSGLEAEVLRWFAAGKDTGEIGQVLCMPECAVERHLANAMAGLNLTSREHLASEAFRRGYLDA